MLTKFHLIFAATLLVLLTGCIADPGSASAHDSSKYTLENTGNFMVMDKTSLVALAGTGVQMRTLADGRLEVIANIKNREKQPVQIVVNCVFKDALNMPMGDETAFQTITLHGGTTEALRFMSKGPQAKNYTVCVRTARAIAL